MKDEKIANSTKNRAMLMILAVGVILAAVSVYLIHMYLTPKRVTVWLFNDNYKAGTALTDDMLYAVQADAKIVVAGAKTDTNTQFVTGAEKSVIVNSGDSLRIDVSAGMPLTKSILSVNGGTSVEMGMDPSKVCVTIPCTSTSGITRATGASASNQGISSLCLYWRSPPAKKLNFPYCRWNTFQVLLSVSYRNVGQRRRV